ncbi:MAG TPA: GTP cyclohydrolase II RibA [Acidimicrobiia bacterium]|jgi:3,4-dihydroxy 2-butanone 4-phosphate synthase/GTP cyclohydrolase II|nr:GTP cyclohydrolase II RibA [Acidimicrobiia bacterium]
MNTTEVVRVPLPTPDGTFEIRAFERGDNIYVAMVLGDVAGKSDVLVRLHSECLTGDALGSLRCDCGVQLRLGLRMIGAAGSGVLIYATGQEGRGIGLVNKLKAYVAQDSGADTVEANVKLGLPIDSRDYSEAAAVLDELGVASVRLLTNNPRKVEGLTAAGMTVSEVIPIPTAPHLRNLGYLNTKERRLDHIRPTGSLLVNDSGFDALDATTLLGDVTVPPDRPFVVVKAAQTVDGRIATKGGDSKWITGPGERRVTHALRAACDAVMVGIGTVLKDNPQLTVRDVPGASPLRVILDSDLRTPHDARVLDGEAATLIFTGPESDPARREELRRRGVRVEVINRDQEGLSVAEALHRLAEIGVGSVLVEGGSGVITSFLASGFADRFIVSIAPTVIGKGTEAVSDLGTARVADGIPLTNRSLLAIEDDLILAWDVENEAMSLSDHVVDRESREIAV